MASSDPSERTLIARVGAYSSWANTADRSARTAAGRRAFEEQFSRQVDPDGTMTPAARAAAADAARRAYYAQLALKSAQARRARKGAAA